MATRKARDRSKEATWRRRLAQQADSGLSVRAWCRRHHVKEWTFHWWRRELARRDAEGQAASFVPVHLVDNAGVPDGDPPIEIVLTNGRRVRVAGVVNRERLTAVLDVLEPRPC